MIKSKLASREARKAVSLDGGFNAFRTPFLHALHGKSPTIPNPIPRTNLRFYSFLGRQPFRPAQYTKYRITKPYSAGSDYEDLYLAEPSRDDFAKYTKSDPTFLRFLKLVTDQEQRPDAFKQFVRRCEAGLVVEKDVYITKKELLENLWENGYSDMEIHAYEMAFPDDYKFHYPELAVLFDLSEEDCYKYCLRVRASNEDSDLVEVKRKSTPNMIPSYGILSSCLWFGAQNNVLGNMWMMVKTWPFFAVFYMLASNFQQSIMGRIHRTSSVECEVATQNRLDGEESIYTQMKQYNNDRRCLDYVNAFQPSTEEQFEQFKEALLWQLREEMIESMTRHLVSIQQCERAIELTLQEMQVRETVNAFREAFSTDDKLRRSALDAAVEALRNSGRGGTSHNKDPVGEYFRRSFQQFRTAGARSSVVQRVNKIFNDQQQSFLDQFTVRPDEHAAIQRLLSKTLSGTGRNEVPPQKKSDPSDMYSLDLSQLTDDDKLQLKKLSAQLLRRVGLESLVPADIPTQDLVSSDAECLDVLNSVKARAEQWNQEFHDLQLRRFLAAFNG